MENEKIKSVVESVLFLSGEPIKISRISKILGVKESEVVNVLSEMEKEYSERKGGLVVMKKENLVQMATNPENASFLDDLIKSEIQENLSKASLEVLSIVAYRGPIGRIDIESIRGVNCSFTLRSLLMRGLVERVENPNDNRSYLYKISFDFLKKLGIQKIEDLPDFEKLSKDERINSIIGN